VRVIRSTDATAGLTSMASAVSGQAVSFDLTQLGYVGQSLGGILGTLFNAVSPDTTNVVLNVPGGDEPQIILNGAGWATARMGLLNTLAQQGIQFGTPAFDQFVSIAQWVVDAADPANLGWRLTHSVPVCPGGMNYGVCPKPSTMPAPTAVPTPNPKRRAFIQFIEGDETVPNISNLALVAAAARPFANTPPSYGCTAPLFCYEFTGQGSIQGDMFDATSVPTAGRHGFLTIPPSSSPQSHQLTAAAQAQAAKFLAVGHL
jgi:hypothetical protein